MHSRITSSSALLSRNQSFVRQRLLVSSRQRYGTSLLATSSRHNSSSLVGRSRKTSIANSHHRLAVVSTHYRHHYGTESSSSESLPTSSSSSASPSPTTTKTATCTPKNNFEKKHKTYSPLPYDRRSLSSLTTLDSNLSHSQQHHDHNSGAAASVAVMNAATASTSTKHDARIQNSVHQNQKNIEVNQLLQSLQYIVQTKQNIGLYSNNKINAMRPKKTGGAVVSIPSTKPKVKPTNDVPSTDIPSSSSMREKNDLDNNVNTDLSEITALRSSLNNKNEYNEIKKWHSKLSRAIINGQDQYAIRLFHQMPSISLIQSYILQSENINRDRSDLEIDMDKGCMNTLTRIDAKAFQKGTGILDKLHKMIHLVSTKRLDVAFEVFLKSEELYFFLEQYLQQQQQQKEIVKTVELSVKNTCSQNDNEQYLLRRRLKNLRGMILHKITKCMENPKSPEKSYAKGKAPCVTHIDYTNMTEELLNIIRNDINDDPLLQHKLYPVFLQSLMKQTVCSSAHFRTVQDEAWETALSSLEQEMGHLDRHSTMEEEDEENLSDDDNDDGDNHVTNVHHDAATVQNLREVAEEERSKWANIIRGYEELLEFSTYRRQQSLPFVKTMELLVAYGGRPIPEVALNIVQNEYPYSSINNTRSILRSIIHLQQSKSPTQPDYLINPTTLEHMTYTVSKRGRISPITVIWEYMNLVHSSLVEQNESSSLCSLYSKPTRGLYENAIMAFAATGSRDHLVMSMLTEMEKEGHKPSRSFLIRLSARLRTRSTVRRLDHTMHMMRSNFEKLAQGENSNLIEDEDQVMFHPTTSSLNAIMCAYADLGLTSKAMQLYNEFEEFRCTPDENTYAFLIDSVLMNISTSIPPNFAGKQQLSPDDEGLMSWLEIQTDSADAIYGTANEMGLGSNEHLLNSYIKILCSVGELEKAMYLLEERLDNKKKILLETFEHIALSHARLGKVAVVKDIAIMSRQAGYRSGLSTFVMDRIERINQLSTT